MIRISNIIQQEEDALGSLSPSFFLPSLSRVVAMGSGDES